MDIDAVVAKVNEMRDIIRANSREALTGMFVSAFEKFPNIEAFKWNQYTPYFNDGDACTFGVADLYYRNAGATTGGDYDDGFEYVSRRDKESELYKFSEGFRRIPDEIFLQAFGDHCKVTATRSGFEVEEYEHE